MGLMDTLQTSLSPSGNPLVDEREREREKQRERERERNREREREINVIELDTG